MLQVTLDIFSGRPNPSWILEENEAQEILQEIANNKGIVTETTSGYQGLGYRGIVLETLTDEVIERYSLPSNFRIANGASLYESKALEIAERLISRMSDATLMDRERNIPVDFDINLQRQLLDRLGTFSPLEYLNEQDSIQSEVSEEGIEFQTQAARIVCNIELGRYNPNFWNDPGHISRNNCYNYATNHRTDTFAQPGRATGRFPYSMDCASVTSAAVSDGNHRRFNCLPDSEKPRYFIAMVVAPGVDYHWYRKQKEGFWGHKPGGTPARNVDNSGNIVFNPETCDRTSRWPSYTQFCGYFYRPKSAKVN
jgi:hypothetical protein